MNPHIDSPAAGTVVLATVSSPAEERVIDDWLRGVPEGAEPGLMSVVRIPPGAPDAQTLERLTDALESNDRRSVLPVRVFWMPEQGATAVSKLAGLVTGRHPYHPTVGHQNRILRRDPSRANVIAGDPATVAQLRAQWRETTAGDHPAGFAEFVVRRARLAVERSEYRALGPEYKSPRLVKPEMLASARFRAGLQRIPGATMEAAGEILDEMATGWGRLAVDLIPEFFRWLISRGFDSQIDYDPEQIAAMQRNLQAHPAVLQFSHRSNLDAAALSVALQQNQLPQAHTFGGINMAFGLMGPLMRRAGIIFIRRKIGDDPLYKYVLKEYVGYLVEKRFNLSWSIEGTRSRTGKMLPPKLGLLSYVADAYLDGRTDDILLQPVSISFDQLQETTEYAAYAQGGEKSAEGVEWLYGFIKAQGERNYGKIYVRFPEPVSMREYLGLPHGRIADDPAANRLALQKMAFEVAWRIQRATPVNATAMVSTLLLAVRGVGLTLGQIHGFLQDCLDYLDRKQTPLTASALALRNPEGVRAALDSLSKGYPVTCVSGGWEPVWRIAPENELAASFYRNSVIHAFLETSIAELALAHAAQNDRDRLEAFWARAMRLRDLLKFDFYFPDSETFRRNIAQEMDWHRDWGPHLEAGTVAGESLLRSKRPLMSYAMLRTFFEAYAILADVLRSTPATISEKDLIKLAMGVGRQYVAQNRIRSGEPVSTLLFATAYQVAKDQGLTGPAPDLAERRAVFYAELCTILRDINRIEAIAREEFSLAGTE